MSKRFTSLFLLIAFSFAFQNTSAQQLWQELSYENYNAQDPKLYAIEHVPSKYKLVSLKLGMLQQQLRSNSKGVMIQLPDEEGKMSRFRMTETSNFEIGLQRKFPAIRSFTAQGIDDPTATAKISLGTDGFHASIFAGSKPTVYVDPYTKNHDQYIVYSRKDLPEKDKEFQCTVEAEAKPMGPDFMRSARNADDGKLRTYRLAVVTSGEYSQFHLTRQGVDDSATDEAKKAAVLSAINTTMTRVNGIFEKDLGVRMVLVSNNDEIIYLDAATDGDIDNDPNNGISPGINDGNASTMIGQTQTIVDGVIGDANYDIGHIFSIGGAGLAGLGVVCRTGNKARGVTGIGSPVGDFYDVDYVAHELGHQFGANHTQNNNCQRATFTSVEPGSASTIMGYAGICAPNVLGVGPSTGNSDDHFHAVSIAEMWNVITSTGTCATETNTGNSAPTADAGSDYSIPRSTAFKLTGSATDADGMSTLTYNWEQIDPEVGAVMPPASTNAEGPMFRSLPSKTTPTRYFPDLPTVVGGSTANEWEVVPSVAREMNFAFTVRDNFAGGGNTARDDMKVTVVDATPFTILSPTTAVTWDTGSSQTITWNKGTTDQAPINCQTVNIKLSTDGGASFPITLASNIPNDGSETIVIPDNATTQGRIMIEAADNIFYTVNSANITINSTTPTFILTNTSGDQDACNTGNQSASYTLNLDFVNGFNESVSFSASGNPSPTNVTFNPDRISADGNVTMTVSNVNTATPGVYTISVQGTSNTVTRNLDVSFQVFDGSFDATTGVSPADGATDVVLAPTLTWDVDGNAKSYDVEVATDSGFTNVVSSGNVTTNAYTTPALSETTTYFWRVKPKNDCGEGNFSSAFSFTTQTCTICNSSGNTEYETSTTLVVFNTIDNTSTKRDGSNAMQGYWDYTSISTSVKRESSYDLTVNVNTDGNFRVQTKVWIDWDGDCVFNDTTEEYDLGAAGNTANGPTDGSPFSITIPANAKLGNTTMRVSSRYTSPSPITYPTACMVDFDGEVEDYTLVIEEATASIEDFAFDGFNLYPNPNSGTFTLKFDTVDTRKTTVELYDVRGRKVNERVFTNTNQRFKETIQFPELSKGLYLLQIRNGNKQTTKKLIIE